MLGLNPEYGVLGSLLLEPSCLADLRGTLSAGDFQTEQGKALWETACRMQDAGEALDPLTLVSRSGVPEDWAAQVLEVTPTAARVMEYAQQMQKIAQRKALEALLSDLSIQAAQADADPATLIGQAQSALEALGRPQTGGLLSSGDAALELLEHRQALARGVTVTVSTGFPSLDGVLGTGLLKSGLYILAARPGVGKTSLGLAIAEQASKSHSVLFVSLEMSEIEITARRAANLSGVSIGAVLHASDLSADKAQAVGEALVELSQRHLTLNRAISATVPEIGLMARSCKAELVVIDYLGLIQPEQQGLSSYERTTQISGSLKRLARSLGCPVLSLAQLNRQSENRPDKKPTLSDLRDSGAIEQDADGVLLIHRPALYWQEVDRPRPWDSQPFEVTIAKNRHGPTGAACLTWWASNGRFQDGGADSWL